MSLSPHKGLVTDTMCHVELNQAYMCTHEHVNSESTILFYNR